MKWLVCLLREEKPSLKLVPEQHLYLNYLHIASLCVRLWANTFFMASSAPFKSNIYPWSCQSFGQLSNKGDACCPLARDSTNELSDLFIKGREIWSFIPEALVGNLHENFMLFTCRSPSLLCCPSPHCRKRSCCAPANPLIEILNSKGFFCSCCCFEKVVGPGSCLLKRKESWALESWVVFWQHWPCWNIRSLLWSH